MVTARSNSQTDILSLEAAAASARTGFACMFSSSDEYENALINERRAEGRYSSKQSNVPVFAFIGLVLTIVSAVIFWM
jgi:hypothetical protein